MLSASYSRRSFFHPRIFSTCALLFMDNIQHNQRERVVVYIKELRAIVEYFFSTIFFPRISIIESWPNMFIIFQNRPLTLKTGTFFVDLKLCFSSSSSVSRKQSHSLGNKSEIRKQYQSLGNKVGVRWKNSIIFPLGKTWYFYFFPSHKWILEKIKTINMLGLEIDYFDFQWEV